MKFDILIAVWGEAYVASLCEITLPSLRDPDPARLLEGGDDWRVLVYTTDEHRERIAAAVSACLPFAACEFHEVRPENFTNPYLAMASAHHRAARESLAERARAIIVPPDAVVSAGSLALVRAMARRGKRAVMSVGPRLRHLTAYEPLKRILADRRGIESRALVDILACHMHPEMLRYNWTSTDFSSRPFMMLWDAPSGWLSRNFHLHPLMIDLSTPTAIDILDRDTIDGEFIGRTIGVWDDIHIVQDSDEFIICTLTPDGVFYSDTSPEPASVERLRSVAYGDPIINPLHRFFLSKAIKIHSGDLDERWRSLEEETGRMVFEILSRPPASTPPPPPPAPAIALRPPAEDPVETSAATGVLDRVRRFLRSGRVEEG